MDALDTMYYTFLKRETQYCATTNEIWATIPFVVEGISKYLKIPANVIFWNSVEIIGQEMVVMVSVKHDDRFQYIPPGALGTRILTIIIPISVVETAEASTIADYLAETADIRDNDEHPELDRGGVVAYRDVVRRIVH